LPSGSQLAQALVGAVVPQTAGSLELADLTALALDGEGGLLATLGAAATVARASARVLGGARVATLVVDVRAPAETLGKAVDEVKAVLSRISRGGVSDTELARAVALASRREREARSDPHRRIVDLWAGRAPAAPRPTLATWRDFLAVLLKDGALIVVEAKPE
jgi:hypothetical protein